MALGGGKPGRWRKGTDTPDEFMVWRCWGAAAGIPRASVPKVFGVIIIGLAKRLASRRLIAGVSRQQVR